MATYSTLNNNLQSQAAVQLRTFDRTIYFRVYAYVRGTGGSWSYTTSGLYYQRFEYVNAPTSIYNNYLNSGIYTGNIIYSSHVIGSISSVVRRTVDLIEGRISNRSISALYCHASCHYSCHGSRGRR